jgi:hypothetical protein
MLWNLSNNELAHLYDSEFVLKLHNAKNLRDTRNILARYMSHLGSYPPSPELAKSFLAQYTGKKAPYSLPLHPNDKMIHEMVRRAD